MTIAYTRGALFGGRRLRRADGETLRARVPQQTQEGIGPASAGQAQGCLREGKDSTLYSRSGAVILSYNIKCSSPISCSLFLTK